MNPVFPHKWTTEIRPCNADSLKRASELLNKGELVAVPTETVYGLAGDAGNSLALKKIYATKGRPLNNPLIIHVPLALKSADDLYRHGLLKITALSAENLLLIDRLIKLFWPGPLTLVVPRGPNISLEATAGGPFVALRQSSHPEFQRLLQLMGTPLAAPSANQSNRISPTTAQHVFEELKGRIPLILDGGPCSVGLESTVLQIPEVGGEGLLKILRHGGITREDLENHGFHVTDQHSYPLNQSTATAVEKGDPGNPEISLTSPGQLPIHYAPQSPLFLVTPHQEDLQKIFESHSIIPISTTQNPIPSPTPPSPKVVLISLKAATLPWWQEHLKDLLGDQSSAVVTLMPSKQDDPQTIARELFGLLRHGDQLKPQLILIDRPSETNNLWPAITDRLNRASKNPH